MNGHIKTPLGVKVTPIKCLGKLTQDVIKKVILGYNDKDQMRVNGNSVHCTCYFMENVDFFDLVFLINMQSKQRCQTT